MKLTHKYEGFEIDGRKYAYQHEFWEEANLEDFVGKVCTLAEEIDHEVVLEFADNTAIVIRHEQDCCEEVRFVDGKDDLACLVGTVIGMAEVVRNKGDGGESKYDTNTWTFVKFRSIGGDCTLSWYGTSNGYYNETVKVRSGTRVQEWSWDTTEQ